MADELSLKYNERDSAHANLTWKASCGPHSIAAACNLTLEQVRAALVDYKGWMSPTQITQALKNLKQPFALSQNLKTKQLCEGVNRIQWEGPWLNRGVPPQAAYRHTHYVAHFGGMVLCTACTPTQWIPVHLWQEHLRSQDPPWAYHITHYWRFSKRVSL